MTGDWQATSGAIVRPYGDVPAVTVRVDDTSWPIDGGPDGASCNDQLRYTTERRPNDLVVASMLSAYEALICPSITQGDAIASLKRARKAAAAAREFASREAS